MPIECSMVASTEDQEFTENADKVQSSRKGIKLRQENGERLALGKEDSSGMTFLGQLQE